MKSVISHPGRIVACALSLLLLFTAAAPSAPIQAQGTPPGSYQTESIAPETAGVSPDAFTPLCTEVPAPLHIPPLPGVVDEPDWVVVATQLEIDDPAWGPTTSYNTFHVVNTWNNAAFGPFLVEELNPVDPDTGLHTSGGLFDVAITPDGKTALMSDFGASTVYFVDLTNPLNPAFLGSVLMTVDPTQDPPTTMFAEDIAISSDGRYALVTDGGFSRYIISIDIRTRTQVEALELVIGQDELNDPIYGYANAVAVGPDGTVVVADYFAGNLHTLRLNPDGTLTYTGTHRYYVSYDGEASSDPFLTQPNPYGSFRPVNVAISPDGLTVLALDVASYIDTALPQYTDLYSMGVYEVTAPGVIEFHGALTGLTHAFQSAVFTENGAQAVLLGNGARIVDTTTVPDTYLTPNDRIYLLDILAPGTVALHSGPSADLKHHTSSQLFGVDNVAVQEGVAYASYPTLSTGDAIRALSVVDLHTMGVAQLCWGLSGEQDPVGVAIRPYIPYQIFLPQIITGP
jgi:hypothetical protein